MSRGTGSGRPGRCAEVAGRTVDVAKHAMARLRRGFRMLRHGADEATMRTRPSSPRQRTPRKPRAARGHACRIAASMVSPYKTKRT